MSRTDASFGQLVAYANRDASDAKFCIHHNLLARQEIGVVDEFNTNAALLKARKNGVVLYHEILSISRARGIPETRQKELLQTIAQAYIDQRASLNLVYGALHDDKDDHLHYHLVISANRLGTAQRHRLTRKHFNQIKLDLERDVLAKYPELEQRVAINKEAAIALSNAGHEVKRRTGRTPKRDRVRAKLEQAFEEAVSKQDLLARLEAEGLQFYQRGKSFGVTDTIDDKRRNYRLKTMGLDTRYTALPEHVPRKDMEQTAAHKTLDREAVTHDSTDTKETETMPADLLAIPDIALTIADLTFKATEWEEERNANLSKEKSKAHSKTLMTDLARQHTLPEQGKNVSKTSARETVAKVDDQAIKAVVDERKAEMAKLRSKSKETSKERSRQQSR